MDWGLVSMLVGVSNSHRKKLRCIYLDSFAAFVRLFRIVVAH